MRYENIHEFNCLREDPDLEGEYIFFGVQIDPISDVSKAIEKAKSKIREDQWDEPIWMAGYWKGGGCYSGGEYEAIDWTRCN